VRALIAPQASPNHNGGLVSRAMITQPVAIYQSLLSSFFFISLFIFSHHPTLWMATTFEHVAVRISFQKKMDD